VREKSVPLGAIYYSVCALFKITEIIEQYKFVIAGAGAVIVAVVGVVVYFKCV